MNSFKEAFDLESLHCGVTPLKLKILQVAALTIFIQLMRAHKSHMGALPLIFEFVKSV